MPTNWENDMERNYTHEQIATDFRLWAEYFDTGATMTEAEFDEMTVEAKVALLDAAFGAEAVVTIGNWTGDIAVALNLMDRDLCDEIESAGATNTAQEFVEAYVVAHAAKYDGEEFVVN